MEQRRAAHLFTPSTGCLMQKRKGEAGGWCSLPRVAVEAGAGWCHVVVVVVVVVIVVEAAVEADGWQRLSVRDKCIRADGR